MITTHRQELAAVLACLTFGAFIGYRTAEFRFWKDSIPQMDKYEDGPQTKKEMDVVRELMHPKPLVYRRRRHHRRGGA